MKDSESSRLDGRLTRCKLLLLWQTLIQFSSGVLSKAFRNGLSVTRAGNGDSATAVVKYKLLFGKQSEPSCSPLLIVGFHISLGKARCTWALVLGCQAHHPIMCEAVCCNSPTHNGKIL